MSVIFFRTVIIFFCLLLFMRLLGKRLLGELELSELIVSVLIADMASIPLQDTGIPLLNGVLSVLVLFCLELIVSGLTLRFISLRRFVFGHPSFLVKKGSIDQKEMKRNRFTLEELAEELRVQGITDISEVEYAVLETDGKLNVILRPEDRPVTAGQMGITEKDKGYPLILISDGNIVERNLIRCGRDVHWLEKQCYALGRCRPEEVYVFICTTCGSIFFARKEKP